MQRVRSSRTPQPSSHTQVLPSAQPSPGCTSPGPARPTSPQRGCVEVSEVVSVVWQALLFSDNSCVGKLVSPEVDWEPAEGREEEQEGPSGGARVGQLALHFSTLVPAPKAATAAARPSGSALSSAAGTEVQLPQPLHLPEDEVSKHSYRVQVIGRVGGSSFAVPHAFRADGRDLTAGLGVRRQWQEYQQRHQAARASAGQPVSAANFAHSRTLDVQSGDGLERLQALFDVASRPAWLKGIVCRFLVAQASQPGAAELGAGSSSAGASTEATAQQKRGGGDAAAYVPAVATSDSMAAAEAVPSSARKEPGSWEAGKERRPQPAQPQELRLPEQAQPQAQLQVQPQAQPQQREEQVRPQQQRQEEQHPRPQQQQQPAAQAAALGTVEGAAGAAAQQYPHGAREGKGRRGHGRKHRGGSGGSEPASTLSPRAGTPRTGSTSASSSSSALTAVCAGADMAVQPTSPPATQPTSPLAAQPTSPPAGRRNKRVSGRKAPGQQAGAGVEDGPGGTATSGALGQERDTARDRRSRSRSSSSSRSTSRSGRWSGQEAATGKRQPRLSPSAQSPSARAAGGGSSSSSSPLPVVPERSEAPPSSAARSAASSIAAAAQAQALPASCEAEQQQGGTAAAATAAVSRQQPTAAQGGSSHAGPAPGAAAAAAQPAASPAAAAAAASPAAAAAAALSPAAASASPSRLAQLKEAEMLAADLLGLPPPAAAAAVAAACDCGCSQRPAAAQAATPAAALPAATPVLQGMGRSRGGNGSNGSGRRLRPTAEDSALSLLAAAVWQGPADSSDLAAIAVGAADGSAAVTPLSSPSRPRSLGAADPGSGSGSSASRPGSPSEREGSVCGSDSSSRGSQLSSLSDGLHSPARPLDWGLSYNYGHPRPLTFTCLDPSGLSLSMQQQSYTSQQHHSPNEGAYRHVRRSGSAFGQHSLHTAASGGLYAVHSQAPQAAAVHHLSRSMPAFHKRSGSSSSSSSQGASGEAAPAAASYHPQAPAASQRWQGSTLSSWAEPYSPLSHHQPQVQQQQQQHVQSQSQPPLHQPPQVMRSQAMQGGRQQWAQVQAVSEPSIDFFWQPQAQTPHRRSDRSSGASWQQQQLLQQQQALLRQYEACMPYRPPPQPAAPPAHSGGSSGASKYSSPAARPGSTSSTYTAHSAPASAATSPLLGQGHQAQLPPPSTPPPSPPLVSAAVLDLQVPESVDDSPDLERFLQAATPQVVPPATGAQDLTLADLWRWYEGPSTVGCEVATIGGPRGPATSYYLPYLSAVQLLMPVTPADEVAIAAAAEAPSEAQVPAGAGQKQQQKGDASVAPPPPPQLLSYPNGLDSWPERMRAAVQWGESANMRDRVPLLSRLQDVCGEAGSAHPLMATRIADLHPFSWFAVAWYPLYCVPEAPLTARFLTFHTLASLWEAASEAAPKHRQQQEQLAAAAAAEAQRQRLLQEAALAAAEAEAEASEGEAEQAGEAEGGRHVHAEAQAQAQVTPARLPSRASYKNILEAGLAPAGASPVAASTAAAAAAALTATPTAVCSFPGSPTCSDAGTRTTLGSSRPHSVDGGAGSTGGSTAGSSAGTGRSRLALGSGSAACSDSLAFGGASSSCGGGSVRLEPGSITPSAPSTPASPAASVAGDAAEALAVPVAGLTWYATGRDENWTETLVAAQLPAGIAPAPGTVLSGGTRLLGTWRGVAVLARPYPVAKGGPLGWEIQQEEMAQCAERLAGGAGLVALRPRRQPGAAAAGVSAQGAPAWDRVGGLPASALGVCCPDYEFFCSRQQRYS